MATSYQGKRKPKGTDPFYLTPEWHATRVRVLRRDGYTCTSCGASVRGKGLSRVDHIRTRKDAPHLAMDPNNLRTLCAACDNRRHSEKGRITDQHGCDANGQPTDPAHWWNQKGDKPA
jgi:5-methylcytosine-specific restriction endonuclease McrA